MRRTYHYDPVLKKLVEGPAPSRASSGDGYRFSDRLYSGTPFKAHDGTVIDSKKKHREYMKRHNLTTVDDFSKTWDKKSQERVAWYKEGRDPNRREDVARAIEKSRTG